MSNTAYMRRRREGKIQANASFAKTLTIDGKIMRPIESVSQDTRQEPVQTINSNHIVMT